MYTRYAPSKKSIYIILLLSLGILLLGSCNRAHHLGMEDNPQEILNTKLNNPQAVLTPNQSISLINYCATLGEHNAAPAASKEVLMVLGNTGTGKSTTLNALLGCKMKAVRPREVGLPGIKKIVIVDPESPRKEVMPIGHGRRSHTFMPQIVPDPDNNNQAYCDCPGFKDNRGAEINIANAINTKNVLKQAKGVKAVFLTSYNGLCDDRGNSIRDVEAMCSKMFGGADNLRRHQNSVLLGITKAPLYEDDELFKKNTVRGLLMGSNSDIATILANRIFLFDPLDRATDNLDFWHREQLCTVIGQLRYIPQQQAKNLFQTTLTDGDQVHLLDTVRQLKPKIVHAITQGDVTALGQHWQLLQRLRVIEHPEVDQLVEGQVVPAINVELRQLGDIETWTNAYDFDQAEAHIARLTQLMQQLPGATLDINLDVLRQNLARCRAQYEECKRREEEIRRSRAELEQLEERRRQLEHERYRNAIACSIM
jgi:energy-coupling factor transporter ATP-binding protein EcfA2